MRNLENAKNKWRSRASLLSMSVAGSLAVAAFADLAVYYPGLVRTKAAALKSLSDSVNSGSCQREILLKKDQPYSASKGLLGIWKYAGDRGLTNLKSEGRLTIEEVDLTRISLVTSVNGSDEIIYKLVPVAKDSNTDMLLDAPGRVPSVSCLSQLLAG